MGRTALSRQRTLRTQVLRHTLAVFLVLDASGAIAQDVGEVVWTESKVELARQGERFAPAARAPLRVGDQLFTGKPGAARLFFSVDVITRAAKGLPPTVNYLNVGDDSLAIIRQYDYSPTGPKARFVLERGTAYALFANTGGGAHYEISTPTAVAIVKGTAFLITYDAATEVTEVVTLSGSVDVRSLVKGEENRVTVTARHMTSVAKGAKPSPPQVAPEERLRRGIEGLEFTGGGRGESLTVSDALRTGKDVRPAEQCNIVLRPEPETFDTCRDPSAPTCLTSEPLGGLGNLDVNF